MPTCPPTQPTAVQSSGPSAVAAGFHPHQLRRKALCHGQRDVLRSEHEPDPRQDTQAWQYNFTIPAATAFVQQGTAANPMVYWLDVQAVVPGPEVFGWKTSDPTLSPHFGDDAVYADTTLPLSMGGALYGPAPAPVFWQPHGLSRRPIRMPGKVLIKPL